jgi:hypothetical protein
MLAQPFGNQDKGYAASQPEKNIKSRHIMPESRPRLVVSAGGDDAEDKGYDKYCSDYCFKPLLQAYNPPPASPAPTETMSFTARTARS